ncbi:MAG: 30S ribosomal protein S18 [Anaerolineaceae bacterium]|nr:30S ribosomal protein S18 [Anaerolineaceae bacterium]MCY3906660.1 30S ribosomal protein S18 [Anaerolineaceae bacterium]MDD9956410.1 30S ribosomal protein S18 [Anaerolineaceae bacterium]MDE0329677.1 30S ribosomal protein S18 [Anaerolineaceae bacterium]MDE0609948.1 30S ribosomal protein S18 [Anaerolineaceae bacterium]
MADTTAGTTSERRAPAVHERPRRRRHRPIQRRRGRRVMRYCPEGKCFDYKDVDILQRYITESGKIRPRRQTGNCARCQRQLAREIKRARHLALLPFVESSDNVR